MFVGQVLGAIGFGLLSTLFRGRPEEPSPLEFEDQATTIAQRGRWLPALVGRRALRPVVTWAGDRKIKKIKVGKKGKSQTAGFEYFEAGMHALAVGPIDSLEAITIDNTAIYEGPLLASMAESGAAIQAGRPNPGDAFVFFGEKCQPINERLREGEGTGTFGIGVASRWPFVSYVEWRRLFLGQTPNWPELVYRLVKKRPAPLVAAPDWIEDTEGTLDGGVNPAHAIWSLMTSRFPDGANIDHQRLNCDCFNALAELFAIERLPVNFAANNGVEGVRLMASLLQDFELMFPDIAGKVAPRALRQATEEQLNDLPVLDETIWGPAAPEIEDEHPPLERNRTSFSFADWRLNYREQTIFRPDDAAVDGAAQVRDEQLRITTVTDLEAAAKVADRRAPEGLSRKTLVKLDVRRAAARMAPGDQFVLRVPGEPERICAVTSVDRRDPTASEARLAAVVMRYGVPVAATGLAPVPAPPPSETIQPDLFFTPAEMPRAIVESDLLRLGVLRVRGGGPAIAAGVLASESGSSFSLLGEQTGHVFGGVLTDPIDLGATIIGRFDDGPVIEQFNDDVEEAEDLSDPTLRNDWLSGRQLAMLGEGADAEVIFVRSLTSLGGDPAQHRLNEVVRGRWDTLARSWPAGTPVLFFGPLSAQRVTRFADAALLGVGKRIYVKSVPFSQGQEVDASSVAAKPVDLVGRAARSLPIGNLQANDRVGGFAEYTAGEDITLTWTYRVRDGLGSAAGELPAGSAIGPKPGREGPFEIEVWSGSPLTLKRTLVLQSDATDSIGVTYADDDNRDDHGGVEADLIEFRVAMRRGALMGEQQSITVIKV